MVMVTRPVSTKPVSVSGIKARNSRRGSEIKDISLSVQTAPGEWGHCRIAVYIGHFFQLYWYC